MQGVTKQFGGNFDLESVFNCIDDMETPALAFDTAFEKATKALKKNKIEESQSALLMTFLGIGQAKKGIAECEAIKSSSWNLAGMEKSYMTLSNPEKIVVTKK